MYFNLLFPLLQESFLFIPIQNNDRIQAQQGAFVFSCILEKENDAYGKTKNIDLKDFFEKKNVIRISKKSKSHILAELNYCGINKATLFPDAEHQMKWILQNEKICNKNIFK